MLNTKTSEIIAAFANDDAADNPLYKDVRDPNPLFSEAPIDDAANNPLYEDGSSGSNPLFGVFQNDDVSDNPLYGDGVVDDNPLFSEAPSSGAATNPLYVHPTTPLHVPSNGDPQDNSLFPSNGANSNPLYVPPNDDAQDNPLYGHEQAINNVLFFAEDTLAADINALSEGGTDNVSVEQDIDTGQGLSISESMLSADTVSDYIPEVKVHTEIL